jgi:O-antigen biosynthesis protein WbqP
MYGNGLKRLLDIAGACIALALFSPLMLAIALAIKLADPGPILFRQRRIGAGGRPFDFYKFRSMPVGTGDVPSDRLGEVRLGRVGRFIRRTNFDELPQLWNVLRGDMSLIGPRPPIPEQAELIKMRRESGALACRPGLTGWAQVNSYDGMPAAKKAAYDAEYARHISFVKDVRIVLRTFRYLLRPPPKY